MRKRPLGDDGEVPDAVGELAQRLKSPKRLAALEPAVPKATETRASPAEHPRVFAKFER